MKNKKIVPFRKSNTVSSGEKVKCFINQRSYSIKTTIITTPPHLHSIVHNMGEYTPKFVLSDLQCNYIRETNLELILQYVHKEYIGITRTFGSFFLFIILRTSLWFNSDLFLVRKCF